MASNRRGFILFEVPDSRVFALFGIQHSRGFVLFKTLNIGGEFYVKHGGISLKFEIKLD